MTIHRRFGMYNKPMDDDDIRTLATAIHKSIVKEAK